MKILALDTASGLCSVALRIDGVMATRELLTTRDHGRELLPMVDALLAEAGLGLAALDALAFGRGPGSFTGLRIAASVAQGLAFGADLPVLPVSDLRALALQALVEAPAGAAPTAVLACLDARMQEVYAAHFPVAAGALLPAEVSERVLPAPTLVADLLERGDGPRAAWLGIGKGFGAYADAFASLGIAAERLMPDAEPRAREVAQLGEADFAAGLALPPEAAVPVYLRDRVAQPPRAP
jgi:tRNA threonylcarbamoyladenosine biosynthesis protein TsaB